MIPLVTVVMRLNNEMAFHFQDWKSHLVCKLFCQRSTYQGRSICNTLAWWQCWLMSVNWKTLCAFIPLYWPTFAEAAIFSSASLLYTRTISHKSLHGSLICRFSLLRIVRVNLFTLLSFFFRKVNDTLSTIHFFNHQMFHRPVIFKLDKVKDKRNFITQAWAGFIWNYSNQFIIFISKEKIILFGYLIWDSSNFSLYWNFINMYFYAEMN